MIGTRESVATTAEQIIARRPVLEPILKAFEPLFEARATLPATLLPLVEESGLHLPEFTEEYASQGRSLLAGMSLSGFDAVLAASAKVMLPLLKQQDGIAPHCAKLEAFFLPVLQEEDAQGSTTQGVEAASAPVDSGVAPEKTNADMSTTAVTSATEASKKTTISPSALAEAFIAGDAATIEKAATEQAIPAEVLLFAFTFILSPALESLVIHSVPAVAAKADLDEETVTKPMTPPWDTLGAWKEGYCPVCGSFPSISYLDRALVDENNQFLAGGGGKKYLHCPLCATNWHFRRGVCPACSKEGPDVMEILRESKNESGERIDWCTKCKSYCPNVDLRARGSRPNFDMMALGMMHLDMVAAKKKLQPLNPSFWNTF